MLPSLRLIVAAFLCGFICVFASLRLLTSLHATHSNVTVMTAHAAPLAGSGWGLTTHGESVFAGLGTIAAPAIDHSDFAAIWLSPPTNLALPNATRAVTVPAEDDMAVSAAPVVAVHAVPLVDIRTEPAIGASPAMIDDESPLPALDGVEATPEPVATSEGDRAANATPATAAAEGDVAPASLPVAALDAHPAEPAATMSVADLAPAITAIANPPLPRAKATSLHNRPKPKAKKRMRIAKRRAERDAPEAPLGGSGESYDPVTAFTPE